MSYPDWDRVRDSMREIERRGSGYRSDDRYESRRDGGDRYESRERDEDDYPRNGRTMRFNGGSSREMGRPHMKQGYRRSEERGGSFAEDMEEWLCDVKEGREDVPDELYAIIGMVVKEMGGGHRSHDHDEEEHERYKDAIERLREAPANEKPRLMKELFDDDLTPDEQNVLRIMSEQKSYRKWAAERGMTLERFKEAKKSLKHKLK